VPLLIVPFFGDQLLTSKAAIAKKLGLVIAHDEEALQQIVGTISSLSTFCLFIQYLFCSVFLVSLVLFPVDAFISRDFSHSKVKSRILRQNARR
jgi:hypothetical protein